LVSPGREPLNVPGDAIGEERPGHLPGAAVSGVVVRSGTSGVRVTEACSDVRVAARAASMDASAIRPAGMICGEVESSWVAVP
jgi:hypothetical protein